MAVFSSLDDLVAFATAGPRVIGLAGAPGAGKTTIAAALVDRLPNAVLLPMDGFHLPQAELVRLGRRDRMGAPDTFDVDGFVSVLEALRAQNTAPGGAGGTALLRHDGDSVIAPGFDRTIEESVAGAIRIPASTSTVVVEGNYLLLTSGGWERVAPLLDATFFVQLEPGIRRERLIERHIRFGKSPEDARAWALGPDESNARLIEATAARADHRIALSVDWKESTDR